MYIHIGTYACSNTILNARARALACGHYSINEGEQQQ